MSEMGITRLKSRYKQGCFASGGYRGDPFSSHSQISEPTSFPWLLAPFSIFKASSFTFSSPSLTLAPFLISSTVFLRPQL